MISIRWDRACRLLAAGLLLSTLPARLLADDVNQFLSGRTYVGLLGTSASFSGPGFGSTALLNYSQYEVTLAPSISQNFGWGVLLGRREGFYAAEVSFWQSLHTSSWSGSYPVGAGAGGTTPLPQKLEGPATLNMVNIDFKRYFLTDLPIQPFLGLGVNIPWLVVDNASANASSTGNAVFEGVGFDLGAGVEYYLDDTFSVQGGFYQRWSGFGQYKGVNNEDEQVQTAVGTPPSFSASGLDFYIGTTLGFI